MGAERTCRDIGLRRREDVHDGGRPLPLPEVGLRVLSRLGESLQRGRERRRRPRRFFGRSVGGLLAPAGQQGASDWPQVFSRPNSQFRK